MAAPQQQGGNTDNSMGIIWTVAAIFVIIGIIWYAFKTYIVEFFLKIKLFEIGIVSVFTSSLDDVRTVILQSKPDAFTFDDIVKIGDAVGSYFHLPVAIMIVILALAVYFTNPVRNLKRAYSMRDLAEVEQINWPQIKPVINLNLIKIHIDKGPWAMAVTPMQFCKRHDLLDVSRRQPQEGMTRKEMNRLEVTLRRGQANKIFIMQLGPVWTGVDNLPIHTKALFTVFAARYSGDTQAAFKLLQQINVTSTEKMDFTGVDALCQKHISNKTIQEIMQSHAYVMTVMAAMLEAARQDGVQASADFLWLKPLDRKLWYMLNTVGRQTPFVEVAGCFAHWVAEKELGKKLLVPMIEEATNALAEALKDIVYKPDEDE